MERAESPPVIGNERYNDTVNSGQNRTFSVNRTGAVRPRKYKSKYSAKRCRIEATRKEENDGEDAVNADLTDQENRGDNVDCVGINHVSFMDLENNLESNGETNGASMTNSVPLPPADKTILADETQTTVDETQTTVDETQKAGDTGSMFDNRIHIAESESLADDMPDNQVLDDLADPETAFIEFIKHQEEIQIEDLLNDFSQRDIEEESQDEFEEETEDHVNNEKNDKEESEKVIYPGHYLPIKTSVLLIWVFIIAHSLTAAQVSDLLTLLSLHMMSTYPALKSFYQFKRYFQQMKSAHVKHYYCGFCYTAVSENHAVCPNQICKKTLNSTSKEYFLELPMKSQLSGLFSREEFRTGLKHRKERVKKHEQNVEDVYDGECYKLLSDINGPLHADNENNISLTFHTDGIPIFKSSKISMWPIFLMVNELPYRMRKSRENMLLCGLWFGQKKPMMNLFCGPLRESLCLLEKGMVIKPQGKEAITVHGYLYCVTCDTPARAMVLNINQHNGEFCCPKCLQSGKNTRTTTGGNIRTFPYIQNEPLGPERDFGEISQDAEEAMNTRKSKNGIKGPSFLICCPRFDQVKNIGIDFMHLLFLGSVRLLLNLWFNVTHSLQVFSLYRHVAVVDNRLVQIKPSHFITRMPRSISEHLKFWKAAELRSWFFYYSIPCVMDLLPPLYLYHYCALVEAIFLLTQSSISLNDIQKSEQLLKYFVFMVPSLYGERYMTINIHSLLHLPQTVRELGPLWSFSCFPFESASGDLLKLFHGTQYVDIQIINAVHVFQTLPNLAQTVPKTSAAYPLIQSMLKFNTRKRNDFHVFGSEYIKKLDGSIKTLLYGFFNKPVQVTFHRRAIIRGVMYHSEDYTRSQCRNSYTVRFINSKGVTQFGSVRWFGRVKSEEEEVNTVDANISQFACISIFKRKNVNIFNINHENIAPDNLIATNFMEVKVPNIHFVEHTEVCCIVPIRSITDLCLYVQRAEYVVICEEPNHHEINL